MTFWSQAQMEHLQSRRCSICILLHLHMKAEHEAVAKKNLFFENGWHGLVWLSMTNVELLFR